MNKIKKHLAFVTVLIFIAVGSWKIGVENDANLSEKSVIAKGSEYKIAKGVVDFCNEKEVGCIEKRLASLGLNFTDYITLLKGFIILFEKNESTISCHQLLHSVGREAGVRYQVENLKGADLAKIDKQIWYECGYGFIHGLVEYLPSEGDSELDLEKISEICESTGSENGTRSACFHGGGHLLWDVWGKQQSLISCNSLSGNDLKSCLAGVWMKEKDLLYNRLWVGDEIKKEELPWKGNDFCSTENQTGADECALAYAPLAAALNNSEWLEWCLDKVNPEENLRCGDNYSYEAINLIWIKSNNNLDLLVNDSKAMLKDCNILGCTEGTERGIDSLPLDANKKELIFCRIIANKDCN